MGSPIPPPLGRHTPSNPFPCHGRGLYPVEEWPHHPLFLRVAPDVPMRCDGGMCLPINPDRPWSFETPLFEGEAVIQIRNTPNVAFDPWNPTGPYAAKKRAMVVLIQGKFKRRLCFSEVKSAFSCKRPLTVGALARLAVKTCSALQPDLEADITAERPYIRNYLASSADVVCMTPPDRTPPNVMQGEPPEGLESWIDKKARRTDLRKEELRNSLYFEPSATYTFGFHSDRMLLHEFKARLPLKDMQLENYLNGQPFPFQAFTTSGEYLWSFELWHEKLLPRAPPDIFEHRLVHPLRDLSRMTSWRKQRKASHASEIRLLSGMRTMSSIHLESVEELTAEQSLQPKEQLAVLEQHISRIARQQHAMKIRANAMVQNAPADDCIITPAHGSFQQLLNSAMKHASQTMREERAEPFSPESTLRYLRLVLDYLSSVRP